MPLDLQDGDVTTTDASIKSVQNKGIQNPVQLAMQAGKKQNPSAQAPLTAFQNILVVRFARHLRAHSFRVLEHRQASLDYALPPMPQTLPVLDGRQQNTASAVPLVRVWMLLLPPTRSVWGDCCMRRLCMRRCCHLSALICQLCARDGDPELVRDVQLGTPGWF